MISEEQMKNDLKQNIINREAEIYGYQLNINNYESMIKTLPNVWRDDLLQYKGMTSEQIVSNVKDSDIELVSDLVFRDKLVHTLKIEKLEQRKAIHVLYALKSQLENQNVGQ